MAFDYQGAVQAGYSNDEINSFLANQPQSQPQSNDLLHGLLYGAQGDIQNPNVGDFAKNAVSNTKDVLLGLVKQAQEYSSPQAAGQTIANNIIQKKQNLLQAGADYVTAPIKGAFDEANQYRLRGLAGQAYAHPASTALDAASVVGGVKGLLKAGPGLVTNTSDLVNGGGSADLIKSETRNPNSVPQNQTLMDNNIRTHPTAKGQIQTLTKAINNVGGQIADAYKNSDEKLSGTRIGNLLDQGLKQYDPQDIQLIKDYITRNGTINLDSSGIDTVHPLDEVWNTVKTLEKNPPKLVSDANSAAAMKQLSTDAARVLRGELQAKAPATVPLNTRFQGLMDMQNNNMPQSVGVDLRHGNVPSALLGAAKAPINVGLGAAYGGAKTASLLADLLPSINPKMAAGAAVAAGRSAPQITSDSQQNAPSQVQDQHGNNESYIQANNNQNNINGSNNNTQGSTPPSGQIYTDPKGEWQYDPTSKQYVSSDGQWRFDQQQNKWLPVKGTDTANSIIDPDMMRRLVLADLAKNGGKNIPTLTAIQALQGNIAKSQATPKLNAVQQADHEAILSGLSALDTAYTSLTNAGGAAGPGGAGASIPVIGQFIDNRGVKYQETQTDTAAQLTKAITGSSRTTGTVFEGVKNSLPQYTDTPAVAQGKLDILKMQMLNRARALGFQDILDNNQ